MLVLNRDIMEKLPQIPIRFIEDSKWNIRRCIFTQEVQRLLGEITGRRIFTDALPGPDTWKLLQELRIKVGLEPYSPRDMSRFIKTSE